MPPDESPAELRAARRLPTAALMATGAVLVVGGGSWLYALRLLGERAAPTPGNLGAIATIGLGLVLFAAGLGVYVLAPGFRGKAAAWAGFGSHRLVLSSTLLVIVLGNLGPVLYTLARPGAGLCSAAGFLTAALSVQVALLGVTYLRFIRPGVLTADDLGLRPSQFAAHVRTGVLLGIAVLIVSALIQSTLDRFGIRQTQMRDFSCIKDFPLPEFLAVVWAGGIMAPVAEELFFRGFVFRSYLQRLGPLPAYGLTSLLFATLHFNLPALVPILVLSLMFCWAYHQTGSIVPGMVGHALNNTFAFAILYFTNLTP
jgi:CAAX protease family protein